MRRRPFPVALSPEERTELRIRAKAHRIPVAAYVRAAALGRRPDSAGVAKEADEWWDNLPPGRRAQVHGWLTARRDTGPDPLTPPLFPDFGEAPRETA